MCLEENAMVAGDTKLIRYIYLIVPFIICGKFRPWKS